MLPTRTRSYTCWQCVYRARTRPASPAVPLLRHVGASATPTTTTTTARILLLHHQQARHNHAAPRSAEPRPPGATASFAPPVIGERTSSRSHSASNLPQLDPLGSGAKIRDLLRQWELDNPSVKFDKLVPDVNSDGGVSNMKNRAEVPGNSELRRFSSDSGGLGLDGVNDPLLSESLVSGHIAEPGDLVEITVSSSRLPVLAIYLGFRGNNYHFYISTGQWRFTPTYTSHFSVSGFADQTTISNIMAAIPANGTTETFLEMDKQRIGPHRKAAGSVLEKMTKFTHDSEKVFQENIAVLDGAFTQMAHDHRFRYLSLFDIAHTLLPTPDGELAPAALYAVHRALMRVDGGFRPVSSDTLSHKRDYLFEVSPLEHRNIIERVEKMTRDHIKSVTAQVEKSDGVFTPREPPGPSALARFVRKARAHIKESRAHRASTPHGVPGPYETVAAAGHGSSGLDPEPWTKEDEDVIRFLEMWAAYRVFSPGSILNSTASSILRFTECYPDIPELNAAVGWLFLQEIGRIAPWELPSRYRNRLPETTIEPNGGAIVRQTPRGLDSSQRLDVAAGRRKDSGPAAVFCIDAATTTLIDDGISLERTDKSDEFWMHVHVADPTSGILPRSQLAKHMELMPESLWLPGYYEEMIPPPRTPAEPAISDDYSLVSGSKSLTISARVNTDGDVLDSRIEPTVLCRVLFLDTEDVFDFCGEKEYPAPGPGLTVGRPPPLAEEQPIRNLTKTSELSPADKEDLATIGRLAHALHRRRKERGAIGAFPPEPTVKVVTSPRSEGPAGWQHDPYIELDWGTRNDVKVVSSPMMLAGEVAAKWCHERGIPIPFRRETEGSRTGAAAAALIREKLTPQLENGVPLSSAQTRELAALLGTVVDTTDPGPFIKNGTDLYTRATSPLRRFSDMLVHWQIHGALALEATLGRRLTPADVAAHTLPDTSGRVIPAPRALASPAAAIPYSRAELEPVLSLMSMRSRIVRRLHRGSDEWILQALVRAWRFGHAPLPETFRFRVSDVGRHVLVGELDWFRRGAVMTLDALGDLVRVADVREGDEFEVELDRVNVHSRIIHVKAVKKL